MFNVFLNIPLSAQDKNQIKVEKREKNCQNTYVRVDRPTKREKNVSKHRKNFSFDPTEFSYFTFHNKSSEGRRTQVRGNINST